VDTTLDAGADPGRTRGADPPPSPGNGGRRVPRFSRGDSGFVSEVEAFLQARLRLVSAVLALAGLALWIVSRLADAASRGWESADLTHPSVVAHLAACLLGGALFAVLRRRRFRGTALLLLDAAAAGLLVGTCILIDVFSFRTGIRQLPGMTALLLIARAVVVPDGPVRTFWLSVPVVPAFLAVALVHGTYWVQEGVEIPEGRFVSWLLWEQATLALGVGTAVLASQVGHSLRRRAWEAGQVERFTLEERIGSGSMGEVWRARHGLLRRPAALKLLRPGLAGEGELRRFENEVRQTARLTHPNTVAVFDYGTTADGDFYYAMELLDGADLDRVVRATGPVPAARAIHLLAQACGSLHEAHGIGLVHRDVKPANLVLCRRGGEDDVLKVMDFGLVRDLSDPGAAGEAGLAGTPLTMAPEVVLRRPAGPAADLYSLGAVGCFLLTGQPIFDHAEVGALLAAHLREEPIPPSARGAPVPRDLEEVLLRCLRKDPGARWESAAAMREALLACADAGRWTPGDARRWWERHGASLVAAGERTAP
jgi:serine/threonine-protein kinase